MDEFAVELPKTIPKQVASFLNIVQSKTPLNSLSDKFGGPGSVYGIGYTPIRRVVDTRSDAVANAKKNNFSQVYKDTMQYASLVSTQTNNNTLSPTKDSNKNSVSNIELQNSNNTDERDSLNTRLSKVPAAATPGAKLNSTDVDLSTAANRAKAYTTPGGTFTPTGINNYATLAYGKIPNKNKDKKSLRDFRNEITANDDTKKILGTGVNDGATKDYYEENNLEKKYGFSKSSPVEGTTPLGEKSFKVKGNQFTRAGDNRKILLTNGYGEDKVTALDISSETTILSTKDVYPEGAEDLIKFYFEDGDQGRNVMPFRCTMTGFSDSFSPGWDRIDIMGRPDGAYLYSSFERSISFSFIVAALTRSEMIPMWRKLNYLASYTMPDFNAGAKPSGPFMRITIGDMFQRTPGFITSLTYNIPDDATWDTASDKDNPDAKQLPMMMEANVSFTIVSDYRPQMMGRVYSLSPGGSKDPAKAGQWLADAET